MSRPAFTRRANWLPFAITLLFAAALTVLLAYGMQRASRLQATSAALQLASGLSGQPQLLRSELTLIQRGLESHTYIGDSLRAVAQLQTDSSKSFQQLGSRIGEADLAGDTGIARRLAAARDGWQSLERQLLLLAAVRSGELYVDSARGSELTRRGTDIKRVVDELLGRQDARTRALTTELTELSAALRESVVRSGQNLRALLLAGTALATLLLAMMLYFALRARRSQSAAQLVQRQMDNILGTVREGLFLVGRDGRIGTAHSSSLTTLLHCDAPAGKTLDELLRPLVDSKTLLAAGKFLGLLWKDKVNEELIESVNPLNRIEVSFERTQGGRETRYLSFAFRRARDASDYVLVAIADISDRVLLQQELEQLKSEQDARGLMLLQLLKVNPLQLESFLDSAGVAFRSCNALLTSPGKEQQQLRGKLDGVFRELHAIKGEAAALGLEGFARRIHSAEDILVTLRDREELSGDLFVPVVTRLDDLMGHADELRELRERLANFRDTAELADTAGNQGIAPAAVAPSARVRLPVAPVPTAALETLLKSLASEVGRAHGRNVQLRLEGLEAIPPVLATRIKDIAVQMIRNAIVHGVESPEARAATGKLPGGTIRVWFGDGGDGYYALQIEDDGQGLGYEQILNRALQLGLVNPSQAMNMDRAAVFRLIFYPGFSTAEPGGEHAGRGVGLDVVNAMVRELGGRIGISTTSGQFTRFKILLPKPAAATTSAA